MCLDVEYLYEYVFEHKYISMYINCLVAMVGALPSLASNGHV